MAVPLVMLAVPGLCRSCALDLGDKSCISQESLLLLTSLSLSGGLLGGCCPSGKKWFVLLKERELV